MTESPEPPRHSPGSGSPDAGEPEARPAAPAGAGAPRHGRRGAAAGDPDAADLARRALREMALHEADRARDHVEVETQQRRVVRGAVVLAVLTPLAVVLTAMNLAGYGPFRVDMPTPAVAERMRQMRQSVSLAVYELEAIRQREGRYPDDLSSLELPDPGSWTYERLGVDRYRVRLELGELSFDYDSRIDPAVALADVRGGP